MRSPGTHRDHDAGGLAARRVSCGTAWSSWSHTERPFRASALAMPLAAALAVWSRGAGRAVVMDEVGRRAKNASVGCRADRHRARDIVAASDAVRLTTDTARSSTPRRRRWRSACVRPGDRIVAPIPANAPLATTCSGSEWTRVSSRSTSSRPAPHHHRGRTRRPDVESILESSPRPTRRNTPDLRHPAPASTMLSSHGAMRRADALAATGFGSPRCCSLRQSKLRRRQAAPRNPDAVHNGCARHRCVAAYAAYEKRSPTPAKAIPVRRARQRGGAPARARGRPTITLSCGRT